ncbi:MAG: hypothetical protein ACQETA_09565 [Bacteroidota bacterium]
MKKVITIVLILIIYPGILSKGMPAKIYLNTVTCSDIAIYLDPDTGSANPFLNITKWELDILTPSSGIHVYGNGILYLSLSKRDRKMISEHISFGDMELVFAPVNDSVLGEPVIFNLSRQIAVPAESITITDDHTRFYYSKLSERDGKVKIYRARYNADGGMELWEINDETLSFCKDNYNYINPTISREGNIMIFSSDMPGSTGDLDLYISRYENNAWTEPENMGMKFNSTGAELYAYLDINNNLYYSSDGLPGLGGFDVFLSSFNGNGWDDPVNLYDQINTSNDEVAFKTTREGKKLGFYTMITRAGILNKKIKRELYKVELSNKYNNNSYKLVDVLRNYALESPLLAMHKAERKLEEERFTDAQRIADSLRTEEMRAERLAAQQREAERLAEQQRKADEKRVADSLRAEQTRAERLAAQQREAERLAEQQRKADEKRVADSLRAEQTRAERRAAEQREAERLAEQQRKAEEQRVADSLREEQTRAERRAAEQREAERLAEEQRKAEEQRVADSLRQEQLRAELIAEEERRQAEARQAEQVKKEHQSTEEVVYKIQFLSSMRSVNPKTIVLDGVSYQTSEYFYKGAWRITLGEFTNLDDAVRVRKLLNEEGYDQAFVAIFVNGERSLDMQYLHR